MIPTPPECGSPCALCESYAHLLAKAREELESVRKGSAKVCRELREKNTALCELLGTDRVDTTMWPRQLVALREIAAAHARAVAGPMASRLPDDRARAAPASAEPLPCVVDGFDRARRTLTLQFAEMPHAALGDKWEARAALGERDNIPSDVWSRADLVEINQRTLEERDELAKRLALMEAMAGVALPYDHPDRIAVRALLKGPS